MFYCLTCLSRVDLAGKMLHWYPMPSMTRAACPASCTYDPWCFIAKYEILGDREAMGLFDAYLQVASLSSKRWFCRRLEKPSNDFGATEDGKYLQGSLVPAGCPGSGLSSWSITCIKVRLGKVRAEAPLPSLLLLWRVERTCPLL